MQKFNSKVNVEEAKVALLTEGISGDVYGAPLDMSGLQSVDQQVTVAEAVLYGDGVALDKISEFVSGTANETTAGEDDDVLALINGQAVDDGEVIDNGRDSKPYLGQSFIAKTRKKTPAGVVEGYTAYFLPKVKFAPAGETLTAKTDSITYSTSALVATIFENRAKDWRRRKFFGGETALEDARAWINAKFGVVTTAPTITSADTTTTTAGTGGTFQVTATGTPAPAFSLVGAPTGVTIGGATGLIAIAGTVTADVYTFTVNAANGTMPDATQSFTLTVE